MLDEAALPFLARRGHVVSLVGGGGKTTLLYQMSAHCACKGWRVLASTTTHIRCPHDGHWARTEAQRDALWAAGRYVVAGAPAPQDKLTQPDGLEGWMEAAEAVFLEADGAKGLPCKAPAAHEPVLLPQSDVLLAVAGLSALGRPLGQVCFRPQLAAALLGVEPETRLTPELLAHLLASPQGGRKNCGDRAFWAVLNQADTPALRQAAAETARFLARWGVAAVATSFEEKERNIP